MNTAQRAHFVIDTSVLVKYFLNEPESAQVKRLLESDVILEAPMSIYAELLNTLKYSVSKSQECTKDYLMSAVQLVTSRIGIWTSDEKYPMEYIYIIESMLRHKKLTSYDALFVSLAHTLNLPLLSEDTLHISVYPKTYTISQIDL